LEANLKIYRREELEEGKTYRFLSAINGEPGSGIVWVDASSEERIYWYQHPSDTIPSQCSPGVLTKFVIAD